VLSSGAETEPENKAKKISEQQEIDSTIQECTDLHFFHHPPFIFFFKC
jgi:hypothetical protein